MDRFIWFRLIIIILIFFAGCTGGNGGQEVTMTAPEGCVPPDDWSTSLPICSIEKQPPDIRYVNQHSEPHNLTIQVIRNNSTVVNSRKITINAATSNNTPSGTWRDVVDEPGNYTIVATVNGTSMDSTPSRFFGDTYRGTGGSEWRVYILESGDVNAYIVRHG